jgi:hypothetical protein
MKWTTRDVYPQELARLIALRSHGGVVALWRWGPAGSPHSIVAVGRDEPAARALLRWPMLPPDPAECTFIGVRELLAAMGVKCPE